MAASVRAVSFLLGTLVLLGTGEPLLAQTREELRAAMRRLRQVEASLEPLPNTGITRDAGQSTTGRTTTTGSTAS
jgi:hypothetical protein